MWDTIDELYGNAKQDRRSRAGRINRMVRFGAVNFEGEGGGGGNGDGNDEAEKLKAQLAEAEASRQKLEAKNKEILDEAKKARDGLKAWEGLEPEKVRAMYKAFENDEDMKLIAEGKHDEVIKRRTEKATAEYEAKLQTLQEENETLKGSMTKAEERVRNLIIDNSIVSKFVAAHGSDTAIEDVTLRAKAVWKIEDGEAVPRDAKGEIMKGKNGVMTQEEWIEGLRTSAPHLFPASQGGGASGGRGTNMTGIDAKIAEASKAGNAAEYRRLREVKKRQESEKE